jgi:hypothetical protein
MDLGYHGDIEIRRCGYRRPHPCQTGPDDQNVVEFHDCISGTRREHHSRRLKKFVQQGRSE